jgi:transposase-like protein
MNPIFKDLYENQQIGGGVNVKEPQLINLRGKYIVWWRAIKGRPVEVVSTMQMPKDSKDVERFFKEAVLPHDDKFDVKPISFQNIWT